METPKSIDAFPLRYPAGWKRNLYPSRSQFAEKTIARARDELLSELKRLGAKNIVISCNLVRNFYGSIRSNQSNPKISPNFLIGQIKGFTSRMLRSEFPLLLKMPTLWTRSYFVSTAGNVSSFVIEKYIREQDTK